jgi:redox-sensitive bicupin YhaK (pirin superfamily)
MGRRAALAFRSGIGDWKDTMITAIPFESLGGLDISWLSARHHFSFGHYHDPSRMGCGVLRVWNDDTIQPGSGFDPHPHRDMEIITYVREGAITHIDRLGNQGRTEAGDVQVMHAGTGIVHAEYNREPDITRIFQIWIEPDRAGHAPGWATRAFPTRATGAFTALASGRRCDDGSGALPIHQDAAVLGAKIEAGSSVTHVLGVGRRAYLVVSKGGISVNGTALGERDGASIQEENELVIEAAVDSEVILVDVP